MAGPSTPTASGVGPTGSALLPTASGVAPTASGVAPPAASVEPEALVAQARARYPKATRVGVEGGVFVLVSQDSAPQFQEATDFVHRVVAQFSDGRFAKGPVDPVFILLFSSFDAFDRWSQAHYGVAGSENLGAYQPSSREMMADVSGGKQAIFTLAHEIAHTYLDEDFPRAPTWLQECVSTVFEQVRWDEHGAIHGAKYGRRYDRMVQALTPPGQAPAARFDSLFGMSDAEFLGFDPAIGIAATNADRKLKAAAKARRQLHYAIARYACVWMDDLGKLFPFYQAFRDGFADDRTGTAAFERVMGRPPAAVQEPWAKWVKTPGESPP